MSSEDMSCAINYALQSAPHSIAGLADSYCFYMLGMWRIEHYRHLQAVKMPMRLGNLLGSLWNINTSEPRDRIYGILGLADDGGDFIPDYNLSWKRSTFKLRDTLSRTVI